MSIIKYYLAGLHDDDQGKYKCKGKVILLALI